MDIEPILTKYFSAKATKLEIPISGTFELSSCCNLSCKMCYVRKTREEVNASGGEIGADQWIQWGKECRDAGMLYLLLTGGEPFLYKDFKKVYSELIKMGFVISINSNGTMIDREMVEFLRKNAPSRINITIYGGSRDTYGRLCGDEEAFDKAVNAVRMLKEAKIPIKINVSLTPYNVGDLEKIYKIAEEIDVYVQATSYMFPPVRRDLTLTGKGDRMSAISAGQVAIDIDRLKYGEEKFKKRVLAFNKIVSAENNLNEESAVECERKRFGCRAGKCAFWINWKGEMTACGMMNKPEFSVFEEGLTGAWKKVVESSKKLYMPAECTTCKFKDLCEVCGASVLAETGDLDKTPKYICEMTKEKIRCIDMIRKEILKEEGEGANRDEVKEGVH